MFRGRWFIGRYFILVLVGVSYLLSSSETLHTFALLSIKLLFPKWESEVWVSFYLFLCSRQCRSDVSPAWAWRSSSRAGAARPASARGVECRGGAWARGGACPRSAAARRTPGWRLQAQRVATVAVAGAGCLWALCSSRRIPLPSSASSLPQARETQRRSALELWCLILGAPPEKAKCSQVQPVSQSCPGTPAVRLRLLGDSTV